ncbi:MAG: DUF4159 domain-containing protein [Chloroflexi bacterium]|nr:MAG: DUF4159 domain-containing protein [Chloroflexota bacterium]
MNSEELFQHYPAKRIKPFDGMAITAAVWDEAHEYHRRSQGLHALFSHGAGILSGLEVIASDPPDTSLYILPGIGIDQTGQVIVLPQPVAYDIGHEMEGLFHLVLSYGESSPKAENGSQLEGAPTYIHSEFSISAQVTLTDDPGIELARIRRSSRKSVLLNAKNPIFPDLDEVDLRFRQEVGAPPEVKVAVSYLGDVSDPRHGRGATYLAQNLNHSGKFRISVEDNVVIGPGIVSNTLIYLVGQGDFELSAGAMNGLRNYVRRGNGTLLIESIDDKAEASFMKMLTAKDMKPEPLKPESRLLTRPYYFAAPPPGYQTEGNPRVEAAGGVIFSTNNYGLLWQGERQGRLASREEIRAAVEWGGNIITYAAERRRFGG